MPPSFKTYPEIYNQMLASLQTSFPGALFVQRSLLLALVHATALQQADTHVLGARILESFSIDGAKGEDLDRRVLVVGLNRRQARVSRGEVQFADSTYTSNAESTLTVPVVAGATVVHLQPGAGAIFAAYSPLGKLILGRATAQEEKINILSVVGDTITLSSGTANPHALGEAVYRSTVGNDRVISAGTEVYVPSTLGTPDIYFTTLQDAILYDGDEITEAVDVVSSLPGAGTVVSALRIKAIESPPFQTCTVINAQSTYGGRDQETDEELRDRYKRRIRSLSKGTPVALEDAALGVESNGAAVTYARVVEPVGPGSSRLYIDDGSGTINPGYTTVPVTHETPIYDATPSQAYGRLLYTPVNGVSLEAYKDVDRGVATAIGSLSLTDSNQTWTPSAYATDHVLVDDQGGVWTITANTATQLTLATITGVSPSNTPSLGGYAIVNVNVANKLQVFDMFNAPLTQPDATYDLLMNYSTGEFQLNPLKYSSGMTQHGAIVALTYQYNTGLIQEVNRVINGDPSDSEAYPGYRAAGTVVYVDLPQVRTLTFTISITVELGYTEAQVSPLVKDTVVQYINSRGLDYNQVFLSEVIRLVKSIVGIRDVRIIAPTGNVVMLPNELPRTDSTYITVV